MLDLEGYKGLRKVLWQNLKEGMVYLGGVELSQGGIEELKNYPVLTKEIISKLFTKYHFLKNKIVFVAESNPDFPPLSLQKQIREGEKKLVQFNEFRREYLENKQNLIRKHSLIIESQTPLIETKVVDKDFLIKDRYSSFSVPIEKVEIGEIPSITNKIGTKLTLGDILSGKLNEKFNFPDDKQVVLHLVVDYSFSMDSMQKLDLVISAVHSFYSHISEFFLNTKIKLYVFSNECKTVQFPINGKEIAREETYYSTFIKKVLNHKDHDVYNKVILFTDGNPSDFEDAIELGKKFKNNKIDYTQLIFFINDDIRYEVEGKIPDHLIKDRTFLEEKLPSGVKSKTLSEEELEIKKKKYLDKFTQFAEACGGNQIVISIYDFINLISVECYDRYVGMLTLASPKEVVHIQNETIEQSTEKVKKMDFKKLW